MARLAERMRHLLAPFVLRRLKSEVAGQLTPKQHHVEQVRATATQGALYKQAFSDIRQEARTAAGEVLCWGVWQCASGSVPGDTPANTGEGVHAAACAAPAACTAQQSVPAGHVCTKACPAELPAQLCADSDHDILL